MTAFNRGVAVAVVILGALGALTACTPASDLTFEGDPPQLHTIPFLKSYCTAAAVTLHQEIAIRGVVTGNDLYGEFYREVVIEDAQGGIAIAIDTPDLAARFPLGCVVTVSCNSLTLCNYGGRISLGTAPDDNGIGPIPASEIARFMHVATPVENTLRPRMLDFTEVAPYLIDTYVCLPEVQFIQHDTWCDIDPATGRTLTKEHTLIDAQGNMFRVRALWSCTYAKEHLPEGKCSVYGIIGFFNGTYSLRVSGHKVLPFSKQM